MPTIAESRAFIESAELPPRPTGLVQQGAETAQPIFDSAKDQATVVASEVVSFVAGVDKNIRDALMNCALLAQLVASKKVADRKDIYSWYDEYFDVLRSIGWDVQDSGFSEYSETGVGFEVHEKILEVAAVLLGPSPAALAVVKATLEALKGMKSDNGWITIFNRETQYAESARFQISVATPTSDGGVMVGILAFGLKAKKTITQVLFFKVTKNEASLRADSAKATIDVESLNALADDVRDKVRSYQKAYVASLEI
jgi:hypothetical protein